jgi:2-polyprenyl-6-methoxyphenol hydroxylase-like FAD-dependent oxidoreductase
MNYSTPVLIVGAGPTGLMMAAQLTRRGINFRIIDKSTDHTTQSRALVVQARSLEILDQMGLASRAIRLGKEARAVTIVVKGRRVMTMALGEVGLGLTRFPYLLMLEQSKTEQLLGEFLAHHGHRVERQTELVEFSQNETGVSATLRGADGQEERVVCDWLIGADGGHSLVRERLGIDFQGRTYTQSLFVLDCEVSLDLPRDEMMVIFSDQAFTGLFPLPNGRMRVLGTVPPGYEGQDQIPFEALAPTFGTRVGFDIQLLNPEWLSVYHAHHRAVSTFQAGRCFLMGDAAHIHSPVGAQGMNTGLQDAYNLAWKLAMVVRGEAGQALLATYHGERFKIAHNLVQTTDRAFYYVTSEHPVLRTLRLRVLPRVLPIAWSLVRRQRSLREVGFKTVSQIGLQYRFSPLSEEEPGSHFPGVAPRSGERLPYTGAALNLQDMIEGTALCVLLFPAQQSDVLVRRFQKETRDRFPFLDFRTIELSPQTSALYYRFGVQAGGYYLVRPDSYIAYRGRTFDPTPFLAHLNRFLT